MGFTIVATFTSVERKEFDFSSHLRYSIRMNSSAHVLNFQPRWYDVGDPDTLEYGFLYGLVAMASIWIFESLVHRILFPAGLDLSLSEAAAIVVFKGCNWNDLAAWLQNKSWLGERVSYSPSESRLLNRKAILAAVLRFFVVILDVLMILSSVPRAIPVLESNVGSSEINLKGEGVKVISNATHFYANFRVSPCVQDKLRYDGFTPTAVRQICFLPANLNSIPAVAEERAKLAKILRKNEDIIYLSYNKTDEDLYFYSVADNTMYMFTHSLRITGSSHSVESSRAYSLPLPFDIVAQAKNKIMSSSKYKSICSMLSSRTSDKTKYFIVCRPKPPKGQHLFSMDLTMFLLVHMSTRKVPAVPRKRRSDGAFSSSFPVVGTVNRPRISAMPALITLMALIIADVVVRCRFGSENVMVKLFHLSKEAAGADYMANPFCVEDRSIPFVKSNDNGEQQIGYLSHGTPRANLSADGDVRPSPFV